MLLPNILHSSFSEFSHFNQIPVKSHCQIVVLAVVFETGIERINP